LNRDFSLSNAIHIGEKYDVIYFDKIHQRMYQAIYMNKKIFSNELDI